MPKHRTFRLTLLALPIVAILLGVLTDFALLNPGPGPADPQGYFAWQQSLLVDGDLDPANQLAGHPEYFPDLKLPWRDQPARVNKYPIGWSMTVLPATAVASAVVHWTHPDGIAGVKPGHEPAYGYAVWVIVPALGAMAVWLAYRTLRHYFDADTSALAVVTAFFGSSLLMYLFVEPYMAHGVNAFWLTLTYWCIARYSFNGWRTSLIGAALAGGMVVLTRPMDGVALLPAAVLLLLGGGQQRRTFWADFAVAGLVFLATVSLQGWLYLHLYGRFFFNAYGANGEHFTGSLKNLVPFLFDYRWSHGLFVWHPVLAVSLVGLLLAGIRHRLAELRWASLTTLGAIGVIILMYAFWWYWWLGVTWGARWTAEFLTLWALGIAGFVDRIHAQPTAARRAAWYCLPLAAVSLVMMSYSFVMIYINH